jgi:hypothetical protein
MSDHIPHRKAGASVRLDGETQICQEPIEGGTATVDCGGVSLAGLNVIRAVEFGKLDITRYGVDCVLEALRQVTRNEFGPLGVQPVERKV